MREPRDPIVTPIPRFEYSFDAEVLDPDLRRVLAGEDDLATSGVAPFMAEIRHRIESTLAATPGLRVGIGLSGLHCLGITEIPETTETR